MTNALQKDGFRDSLSTAWLILRESFKSFSDNKSLQSAATLAYYGFLSLMPLLLLVIFLLGLFMHSSAAVLKGVEGLAGQLFPAFDAAVLQDLAALSKNHVWGLVGVFALIWSMTPFAGAFHYGVVRTFKQDKKESFIKAKLIDVAAVLVLLLLFVVLVATKIYFESAPISLPWVLRIVVGSVLPFVLTVSVISFFYAVFAPLRLKLLHLAAGSLTTAFLLAVIRPLFGLLLQYNPNYGYAFGSLKAIFLSLVWAYYTFAVLLFGAEVMANVQRKETLVLRGLFAASAKTLRANQRLLDRFVRKYVVQEILFREGDDGREMFYVLTGSVALTKNGQPLKTMKAGDYFGEMSMLIHAPRTATATIAEDETQLIPISENNFETILRENPKVVQALLRELALRLKATSERASAKN